MENITPYAERINTSTNSSTSVPESSASADASSTVSSEDSTSTGSAASESSTINEPTEPSHFRSFEQSYLEIEPLVLKVGGVCIVLVAIGSFLSLFIKKKKLKK